MPIGVIQIQFEIRTLTKCDNNDCQSEFGTPDEKKNVEK